MTESPKCDHNTSCERPPTVKFGAMRLCEYHFRDIQSGLELFRERLPQDKNMQKNKIFIITAGGTHEHIDDVRYITNHATGALPAAMAEDLLAMGHDVVYVHGPKAITPRMTPRTMGLCVLELAPVCSAWDMANLLAELCTELQPYAVICAAAVGDFAPERVHGKISSQQASADGSITIKLYPTHKVIDRVKTCAPKTRLLGFKFLAGATEAELVAAAHKLMERSGATAVFCNTLEQYEDRKGFLITMGEGEMSVKRTTLDGKRSVYNLAHEILKAWL